jgi:CHAT domain-containing protein
VLIPVHAAGIYQGLGQECCADYVVSSYAPTLTALLRAQNQARVHATGQAQMVSIAVERAHDPALSPLPCVGRETRQIVDIATSSGVRTSSLPATVAKDEVIGAFQSANVVHLACHGIQDSGAPHESRFCLGSTDLAVSDLIRVDLPNAFFAFLSACDTAKGTQKHADEVVHLAATMLFAGFQSVAATMW